MAVKAHITKSQFQFCSSCGGLLLPKEHKKYLQCIACGKKQDISDKTIILAYESKPLKNSNQKLKEKLRALKTPVIEDNSA